MHVLAEGRWPSSAGLMVTDGIGWKPSSEAGRAGEPEIGIRAAFERDCCKSWELVLHQRERNTILPIDPAKEAQMLPHDSASARGGHGDQ